MTSINGSSYKGKEKDLVSSSQDTAPQPAKKTVKVQFLERSIPHPPSKESKSLLSRGVSWIPNSVVNWLAETAVTSGELGQIRKKNLSELSQLVGNEEFGFFLQAMAPKIAHLIEEKATDDPKFKEILQSEERLLVHLLSAMLPKIIVNIAKQGKIPEPVTSEKILAFILGRVFTRFHELSAEVIQIQSIEDKKTRLNEQRRVFGILAEELLKLGFPQEHEDIPLFKGLRGYVWRKLKNEWLPDLLADTYEKVTLTVAESKKDKLAAIPGGDSLAQLCDFSANAIQVYGPKLLNSQKEAVIEFITGKEPLAYSSNLEELIDESSWSQEQFRIHAWLNDQIKGIAESSDPAMSSLWCHIGTGVNTLVAHVLFNLAIENRENEDAGQAVIEKLSNVFHSFVQANGKKILDLKEALLTEGKDPLEDPVYMQNFIALSKEIQFAIGFTGEEDEPFADFLHSLINEGFESELPKLLAAYFENYLIPATEVFVEFNNPQPKHEMEILKNHVSGKQLAFVCQLLGEAFADQVPTLCAQHQAKIVENLAKKIPSELPAEIQVWVKDLLDKQIERIGSNEHPQTLNALNFLRFNLEGLMAHIFLQEADRVKVQDKDHALAIVANRIFKKASHYFSAHEQLIRAKYDALVSTGIDPSNNSEFLALLTPLSDELLAEYQFSHADSVSTLILEIGSLGLQQGMPILLAILYGYYQDTSGIFAEMEANRSELQKKTSHAPEACRILAEWTTQFLPLYIESDKEDISTLLFESLTNLLAKEGLSDYPVEDFLKDHDALVKEILAQNIVFLLSGEGSIGEMSKPFIQKYIEGVLLKVLDHVTGRVDARESPLIGGYDNDFLVELSIRLLNTAKEYTSAMNEIRQGFGAQTVDQIDPEVMFDEFDKRGLLHIGIPNTEEAKKARVAIRKSKQILKHEAKRLKKLKDPADIKRVKNVIRDQRLYIIEQNKILNQHRLEFFSKPLAGLILKNLGWTTAEDLPFSVPGPAKELMWEELQETLLPNLILKLFNTTVEPRNRYAMLAGILESLGKSLDEPNQGSNFVPIVDEHQKNLNAVCGDLILELSQAIPQSLLKLLLKIGPVQDLTKDVIGQAFREQLTTKWTALSIIDLGLEEITSKLYPGEWKEEGGEFKFEQGDLDLSKTVPVTEEEKDADFLNDIYNEEVEAKLAQAAAAKTGRKLLFAAIQESFVIPFKLFSKNIDKLVRRVGGENAVVKKHEIERFALKIYSNTLGAFLSILTWPVKRVVRMIVEFYFAYKASQVSKIYESEIHENLLMMELEELLKQPEECKVLLSELVKKALESTFLHLAETSQQH